MAFLTSKDKKTSITELLEDLTHLEINTIVKDGMLATPGKKKRYDIIRDIFDNYLFKFNQVIKNHKYLRAIGDFGKLQYRLTEDADFEDFLDSKVKTGAWGESSDPISFKELRVRLKSLNRLIRVGKNLRLSTRDFTIMRRVAGFCEYIFILDKEVTFTKKLDLHYDGALKIGGNLNLYESPIKALRFDVELETADEVKIKRMRDLGTETIVMQTRVGLDGDVITRIERDFAESGGGNSPFGKDAEATKNTVIGLHEKHIDISIKYWNSLVNMVKDFVSGLIDNK